MLGPEKECIPDAVNASFKFSLYFTAPVTASKQVSYLYNLKIIKIYAINQRSLHVGAPTFNAPYNILILSAVRGKGNITFAFYPWHSLYDFK
jgi:hypothetical protein